MLGSMQVSPQGHDAPARSSAPPLVVALIDRDTGFLQVVAKRLERAGHGHRVLTGPVPPSALVPMRVNAVVVDLDVIGPHAEEWLERLAREMPALGIVVCTAGSSVMQRVRGLRLGADDWIGKPCHPEEVLARVEVAVRRHRRADEAPDATRIETGDLEISGEKFQVFAGGRSVDLTRREFEVIELLARSPGRVLEREEIYERIWGYQMIRGDRSVDVFVRKLRQKLERGSPGWRYVHTHFGVGYRFEAERVGAKPGAGAVAPAAPALAVATPAPAKPLVRAPA
jgi:DNA-binding response OmpR family regulator